MHILLNKKLIGNNILGSYKTLVTHTEYLNKFRNLLVFMNIPEMKPIIISILKDASNISEVIRLKS